MQHFPVFLDLAQAHVVIGGGGEMALAKLRLLLKTEAKITVCAPDILPEIRALCPQVTLVQRPVLACDLGNARLVYATTGNMGEDARIARLGRAAGALVNIVDNLQESDFITPAIVDRDPVVVAIGTEGAAPVLARKIKAQLEDSLPPSLGVLARIGKSFRKMAEALPQGPRRRAFWAEYYDAKGPRALHAHGEGGVARALDELLARHLCAPVAQGHVDFVSAGPGDPELMTLKARKLLDRADVVIHDRLVTPEILELARREAVIISVGKEGFGPSTAQDAIHALMLTHARRGAHVVRLKGGDASVFGRLDEETAALDGAGIPWQVVPGVTAASSAAASIGQSLTSRGRNHALRLVTAHDMHGFADQDWQGLAAQGAVTALYMGKRAARFVQGRLLMHGAAADMPVTLVENASRAGQRVVGATLATLPQSAARLDGPAVILLGLAPRQGQQALSLQEVAQ
ncbi:uroporphyrin-III C-methyltransferase/precorrin-2 dehydrogenase/sirohydrochlorin ferrochelatase [Roseinatronobacter thiooxidans]|uniref:Uroporphyrin-III C-methyltransferase/precorrin-2 dehydrogenase/sirohydrochlorin ferrochelatase n=1 Tax=Roseinatronobacter thiooxidans TaxID=121821 RepID=A0A2W7Q172_9RHOB|nr:siroheme synthase CysG [Roseinatronobacter thiooxidans]PZX42314.1 uroporphyrin-III C-methyltransferase/precorrin-2 dehydrogenase/sirohydrochlorin ferrochelatase [Roseinatronobacter thiooxidans]